MTFGDTASDCAGSGVMVVAHPDDETLWLQPHLADVDTVVVAFPLHPRDAAITAARRDIRDRFPFAKMEFLATTPIEVLGCSDRRRRAPDRYGVKLRRDTVPELLDAYRANYDAVRAGLVPYLEQHRVVYTHNPWGEYGHEEHVQVCRAVLDVGADHGSCVWAWDGLPTRELARTSMRLRADFYERQLAALPRQVRSLDVTAYRQLRDLYEESGAWTWFPDYQPPLTMQYVEIMHHGRELLRASAPQPVARELKILGRHLRNTPSIVRRLSTSGHLRAG